MNPLKLDTPPNQIPDPLVLRKEVNTESTSYQVTKLALGVFLVAGSLYLLSNFSAEEKFSQILEENPSRAVRLANKCLRNQDSTDGHFNCKSIIDNDNNRIEKKIVDSVYHIASSCLNRESENASSCPSLLTTVPFLMETSPEDGSRLAILCALSRNTHCLPSIKEYFPTMVEKNLKTALLVASQCLPPKKNQSVNEICESIVKDAFPLFLAKDMNTALKFSSNCIEHGKQSTACKSILKDYMPQILQQSPEGAKALATACRPLKDNYPDCKSIIDIAFSKNT
jgi:Zn-dependent M16 (insulinase) family peptidase